MLPSVRAYAKINLGLRILCRRGDGYHDIETILHRIDLCDEIRIELSDDIQVISDSPAAPSGKHNLCHRAVTLLQMRFGVKKGAEIRLTKRIPVGAGLGGGSSDAAAVLRFLPRLWGIRCSSEELARVGAELGSDVPFFLRPGTAIATGRGEKLEYLPFELPYFVLLAVPEIHVSTEWAYRKIRVKGVQTGGELRTLLRNDQLLTPDGLKNDFEPTVFSSFPAIREIKSLMLSHGAVTSSLTGSGSGVFGLFADLSSATDTMNILAPMGLRTSLTAPSFVPPDETR